jgi:hypothetical protein
MATSTSKFFKRPTDPDTDVWVRTRWASLNSGFSLKLEFDRKDHQGTMSVGLDRADALYLAMELLKIIHDQDKPKS